MNDKDCLVTFEQTKNELEEIERRLAMRYGLRKNVRLTLIQLDRDGHLVEDSLVADWHSAYASYLDWLHHEPTLKPKRPSFVGFVVWSACLFLWGVLVGYFLYHP